MQNLKSLDQIGSRKKRLIHLLVFIEDLNTRRKFKYKRQNFNNKESKTRPM